METRKYLIVDKSDNTVLEDMPYDGIVLTIL